MRSITHYTNLTHLIYIPMQTCRLDIQRILVSNHSMFSWGCISTTFFFSGNFDQVNFNSPITIYFNTTFSPLDTSVIPIMLNIQSSGVEPFHWCGLLSTVVKRGWTCKWKLYFHRKNDSVHVKQFWLTRWNPVKGLEIFLLRTLKDSFWEFQLQAFFKKKFL